jgi:hypothetical protein
MSADGQPELASLRPSQRYERQVIRSTAANAWLVGYGYHSPPRLLCVVTGYGAVWRVKAARRQGCQGQGCQGQGCQDQGCQA